MPPWLATGMIVATVAVVCALYSFWNNQPPQGAGGHSQGCGCHQSHRQPGPSNQNRDRHNNRSGSSWQECDGHERYDTLPDCRRRQTTDDVCAICLDPIFIYPQHTLQCHHKLHVDCFRKLRSQSDSCPICRRPL